MGYKGKDVVLSYETNSMLPEKDSTRMEYQSLKNLMG